MLNHLVKDKYYSHSTANQETQLIALEKYAKDTLEGKIDLEKVREIIKAIKRRFYFFSRINIIYLIINNSW